MTAAFITPIGTPVGRTRSGTTAVSDGRDRLRPSVIRVADNAIVPQPNATATPTSASPILTRSKTVGAARHLALTPAPAPAPKPANRPAPVPAAAPAPAPAQAKPA